MSDFLSHLGLSAITVLALLSLVWLWHIRSNDLSLIDLAWGLGFVLVAAVLLLNKDNPTPYHLLLASLPIIWGLRLTLFLARRNLGHGEDDRYTKIREDYIKRRGSLKGWLPYSYFIIYGIQALFMIIVSLPVIIGVAVVEEAEISHVAWLGAIIWLIGFLFEAIGDYQLSRFKKTHAGYDGPYAQKPLFTTGLWAYTRHPNYFGNSLIWIGIGLVAISQFNVTSHWFWLCIMGPIFMIWALVSFTGKANNERKMQARPAYADYVKRTSGFIPWFPKKD